MKRFFEAREKLEKELFGKEKNTMKTYFRADEMKEATGNGKIAGRKLMQENRVLDSTFKSMNCNSEEINVMDATKIAVNDRVYAIVGYHCGEILAVKIGEEIVDGFVNLYMIKNRAILCEAKLAWLNCFKVEKIGIIEAY